MNDRKALRVLAFLAQNADVVMKVADKYQYPRDWGRSFQVGSLVGYLIIFSHELSVDVIDESYRIAKGFSDKYGSKLMNVFISLFEWHMKNDKSTEEVEESVMKLVRIIEWSKVVG